VDKCLKTAKDDLVGYGKTLSTKGQKKSERGSAMAPTITTPWASIAQRRQNASWVRSKVGI